MAEISTTRENGNRKTSGVQKLKKQSTRVDLTPMVDLGFLLITFFIFTTSVSQPTAMWLPLPNDSDIDNQMPTKENGTITLLLGDNHSVYYYEGQLTPVSSFKNSTIKEIREVIINKKKATAEEDLFVILKPGKESTYNDVVDILDEMTINDVKRYALVDITDAEAQRLER